ncbi:hypothetical protein N0V82_007666 [Gnomoniopsis sp. IMI 355080]|nr:hypothetical protein N0V82_007666 [Gnomoniopsis sp. IMI 355080]
MTERKASSDHYMDHETWALRNEYLRNKYLPSRPSNQAKDNGEHRDGRDHQAEEEHIPGVKYLDDDNDLSYPAYEKQPWELPPFPHPCFVPRPEQIYIYNMADMRREAAAGAEDFELVVQDIDSQGWAAGFDDMAKLLKWGDRFRFDTPEHFDGWWWFSGVRDLVKDAADVLARTPPPQDGFYGSDVAGTPWEVTPEHFAASVAGSGTKTGNKKKVDA